MNNVNKEHDRLLKCVKIMSKVEHNLNNKLVNEYSKEQLRHISYKLVDKANAINKIVDKML